MTSKQNVPLLYLIPGLFLFLSPGGLPGAPDSLKDLSQQIFDVMSHAPGVQPGSHRVVHAKGLVCQGTFEPSNGAPRFPVLHTFVAARARNRAVL